MLKISVVCLYFAVVAVNFWNVNGITEEKKKAILETIKPIAENCASECGLNEEDLKKYNKDQDNMNPFFKKCLLRKLGLLDVAGKYYRDAFRKIIAQFTDDVEKAKKIQDQLDSCFYTNGDNECDDEESQMKRVDVLFKCLKEFNNFNNKVCAYLQ